MDIRWEQRFSNFLKAMDKLEQSITYIQANPNVEQDDASLGQTDIVMNEMLKEGLIQRFEYTHELAWNVMKDYAEYQGNSNVGGSRDAIREAFKLQIISNGEIWMDMIASRNKTSHIYNEETANEIYSKIIDEYFPVFMDFKKVMENKYAQG